MKTIGTFLLLSFSFSVFAQSAFECEIAGGKVRLDYIKNSQKEMVVARGLIADEEFPGTYYPSGNCQLPLVKLSSNKQYATFSPDHKDENGFSYCVGKLHNEYRIGAMDIPVALLVNEIQSAQVPVSIADKAIQGPQGHYLAVMNCSVIK